MNVQVVYCTHHTASLSVRERLAFSSEEQLRLAYARLRADFPDSETVLLSTCNRVELYAAGEQSGPAPSHEQLARFFAEFHEIPLGELREDLLEQTGPEAVRHLFRVASSVDSMVLGEPQIVNQVKEAYRIAYENDACGPLTNALFQRAVEVSKRIRSETRLSEGRVSVASVAVGEFGKSIFDRFDDKTVLVLGAGEMAEETLRYLKNEGMQQIIVVNRNKDRAEKLAAEWGGTAEPIEDLNRCLAAADVIVSTTGADRPIVDAARFSEVRRAGGEKPVFILDLGAPRDFEPAVGDIDDNVFLYDIDDLETTCEQNRKSRAKEIVRAERIVNEETARFAHEVYHRATSPVVQRLREQWHNVSRQEMERLFHKLEHVDEKDRQQIERAVERIVNKLLHPPLETLKDEAREGPPHGLLDALKRLFFRE